MNKFLFLSAALVTVLAVPAFSADEPIFTNTKQELPTIGDGDTVIPAQITGIEEVSEEEAIARAAEHNVKIPPTAKDSPNYGRPWAIIKAGFGSSTAINLLAEIYVHKNWSIEPGATLGLSYGSLLVGGRWHPDVLCWGCDGKASFTLSPGFGVGRVFSGLSRGPGTLISASAEGEFRYRPSPHLIFAVGVRGSGGTIIDDPYTTAIWNGPTPNTNPGGGPGPAPNPQTTPNQFTFVNHPAKPTPWGDALLYVGIGF
jgi:hypothetical protein